MPVRRRRLICFLLAGLTICIGLVWRLAPLGLPPFWFKYGGSALWAAMIYWIVAGMLPAVRPWKLASAACLIAAVVEFSRLLHTPQLDGFA